MALPRHNTLIPLFEELRGRQVVVRPYRLDDADELFAAVEESRQHLAGYPGSHSTRRSRIRATSFCARRRNGRCARMI